MSFKSLISNLIKPHLNTGNGNDDLLLNFNKRTSNDIKSSQVDLNAVKGHHITILAGSYVSADTTIDSYSFIGFNTLVSKTKIGRYNSIASNVNIGHGEHPIDEISTSGFFLKDSYGELTSKPCTIEHDVWIGVGCTIRRGVNIGIGSVIGANSFVNKDVPPYAIVVGSPAKILRYRFDQSKIDKILRSEWWLYELEEAKHIMSKITA